MVLDDLYQEILFDHYKNPRNSGPMKNADQTINSKNPFCGDEVKLNLKFDGKVINDISFEGQGCVISQASVSLLTQYVKGKTIDEAIAVMDNFMAMMKGQEHHFEENFEELLSLQGVCDYPTRVKCATLAWNALKKALDEHVLNEGN